MKVTKPSRRELAYSTIPINLGDMEDANGDFIDSGTTPVKAVVSNVDVVQWAATVVAAAGFRVTIPDDYDAVEDDLFINGAFTQPANNDTVTFEMDVYKVPSSGAVGSKIEPTDVNVTKNNSTPEELSWDLSGNSFVKGDVLYIEILPGAHANDLINLFRLHGEYVKAML